MKKIFSFILLATFALSINAQRYMSVIQKDGSVTEYALSAIDSIHFFVKDNTTPEPPVVNPNPDDPFENGHEYVDLGLPSGTLWATCNIGAEKPIDNGDYFAWGEVKPKEVYNENTYKWFKMDTVPAYEYTNELGVVITVPQEITKSILKYNTDATYGIDGFTDGKTVLDSIDDAAAVNWGGKWRIPTYDQIYELNNKCTWEWQTGTNTEGNQVAYYKVTGLNGNVIYFPAAGFHDCWLPNGENSSYGYYWSSSLYESDPSKAWFLRFQSDRHYRYNNTRYVGHSVRPVCSKQ